MQRKSKTGLCVSVMKGWTEGEDSKMMGTEGVQV